MGSTPSDSSASTSPSARIVPSSTTLAVPARASTINAVNNGPSSRTITVTITVPMYSSAPTRVSNPTVCPTIRNPNAAPMKPTISSNRTPAFQICAKMSGWTTRLATLNLVSVTPSVMTANAPSSRSTSIVPTIRAPSSSAYVRAAGIP